MLRRVIFLLLFAWFVQAGSAQSLADLDADAVSVIPDVTAKAGEPAWTSVPFAQPATGLVVSGSSADRDLEGWGRFNDGPWRELAVVFSATGETFYAGFHGADVVEGGRFEVRFETDRPLHIEAAGVFDNRLDADRSEEPNGAREEASSKSNGVVVAPRMYSRAEWNAEPFRGDPVPLARPNYLYMAFHHAAGFGAYTNEEGLDQVKAIQNLHQNVRGWSDIGYQFVMDQSGRLYQGRPFLNGAASLSSVPALALGAHVGGTNTGNIGICMLGCYHPPYTATCTDVLSEPALDSLAIAFAFMAENYGVSPDNLRGHQQFSTASTACPGDNNMAIIEELRERVRTYLVVGNAPIGAAQISVLTDEDGVVRVSWTFVEDRGIAGYRVERVQNGTSVIVYEGDGAGAASFADAGVSGPVEYRLYARSTDGREQLLAVMDANVEAPQQHILTENFPDPFSRSTTIRYFLPQDGIVRLAVFDMLGREVDVLDDGPRDGGQWYHVDFDAGTLPAGTYYYRLEVAGFSGNVFSKTRSLVRVK